MTAFSLTTSYLNEISLHDFTERGDYKPPATGQLIDEAFGLDVVRLDATDPDFEAIAVAFGLDARDSVLLVSMPLDSNGKVKPFNPKQNGLMHLKTTDEDWVIQNLRRNRFGIWEMGVVKATENASPST